MQVRPHFPEYSIARLDFCLKMLRYAVKTRQYTNNLLLSPFSAEVALSMAYHGSTGRTKKEISQVLGLHDDYGTHDVAHALRQIRLDETAENEYNDLVPNDNHELHMANGAFFDKNVYLSRNYIAEMEKLFQSVIQDIDFNDDHDDAAVRYINEFIEAHTKDNVHDLLSPLDVPNIDAKFILVSALHLRARWDQQFDRTKTRIKPFTTAAGISVLVDTMHKRFINYKVHLSKELDGAMFLEMPFTTGYCSAIFILPGKTLPGKSKQATRASPDQGLASLIRTLTAEKLQHAMRMLCYQLHVTVQLPRFHVEQCWDLQPMLKWLGMPTAFDEEMADFSDICQLSQLSVQTLKQKACIHLDEEGVDASVTTEVVLISGGGSGEAEFIADRPFLFLIRHEATNTIMLMGHVCDPSQ
ncbi:serpin B6-like [Paramacrobiotus metropolitanus]|uniref:serpin B6-like n=1 Tax=Paramacrobiotus metropolitanus TaxID=2943436 RepID=UPI002445A65A|nr:serpin B6-like [Paramacrobiotus metropolitanus]